MPNPKSILENMIHKSVGFEIQRDRLIPARTNEKKEIKKNLPNHELCCPGGPQSEKQRKQKERQVLEPCQRTKNAIICALGTVPEGWVRELEELEIGGLAETIQTTVFGQITDKVQKILGHLLSLRLQ